VNESGREEVRRREKSTTLYYMQSRPMADMSKVTNNSDNQASQWAEILGQLLDRLTGKGASVTYTFENLVIDMPRAEGPGGQHVASAKVTINGKIMINAETHEAGAAESKGRIQAATSAA
jgi:hypothetical protein